MSEKKVINQANVNSLANLKLVLGEVPYPYTSRVGRHQAGTEIKQAGVEMESVVTKLITHLKKKI